MICGIYHMTIKGGSNRTTKVSSGSLGVIPYIMTQLINDLDVVGLLERMQAGDFDLDMVDYNAPDPPDID